MIIESIMMATTISQLYEVIANENGIVIKHYPGKILPVREGEKMQPASFVIYATVGQLQYRIEGNRVGENIIITGIDETRAE